VEAAGGGGTTLTSAAEPYNAIGKHEAIMAASCRTDCNYCHLGVHVGCLTAGELPRRISHRMMVRYAYFTWSPPSLSEREEIELGRRISVVGRETFAKEFRENMEKRPSPSRPRTGIAAWPKEIRYLILIVLFGGGFIWIARQPDGGPVIAQGVVLCVMILLIYYVSMAIVMWRVNRWIDKIVSKYAAHVAAGGER